MNEQKKTHWKKVVSDPVYIGEGDFQPGQEIIVTIKSINSSEAVMGTDGKSEKKAVVHFEGQVKPMILNVARSKSIEKVAGSPYFEDWTGVKIQLYVKSGIKAFGEVVSAVRVRDFKPREQIPVEPCAVCGGILTAFGSMSPTKLAEYTKKKYGKVLCADCAKEVAEETESEEKEDAE